MPSTLNIVATVTPDTVTNSISQVGHGLAVGDVIRRDSGGSYVKALGDSLANSLAIGVVSQVVSADAFKFVQVGLVNGLSGLVDGTQYYLSRDTAGALVSTLTTTDGEVNKAVLTAISTTAAYVDIKKSDVYATPAGGGGSLVHLNTQNITVAQANVIFNSTYINSTYNSYVVYFREVREQQAALDHLVLTYSALGSYDDNANYPGYLRTLNSAGTAATLNMNGSNGAIVCPNIRTNNAVGAHGCGWVTLQNITETGSRPRLMHTQGTSNVLDGGFNIITQEYSGGAARNGGLDPVDGIKFKMQNSPTLTGVFSLYGIDNS